MRHWLLAICVAGSLATSENARSQELRLEVGSELEDYLRVLQLRGLVPGTPFSIRSLSLNEAAGLVTDSVHPWLETYAFRRPPTGSPSSSILTFFMPEAYSIINSGYPRSTNDGALWAGKGATLAASTGARIRWGPLSATLLPVTYYAANDEFPMAPVMGGDLSPYAYPWGGGTIDYPQRLGDEPLGRVDWGQSHLRLRLGGFTAGYGTENLWLGPAFQNAVVLSNTAPGFPHLDLGTSWPVSIGIGTLAVTVLYGQLRESAFFDTIPDNDRRFFSGLALSYQPRWIRGLSVGAQRVHYRRWSELDASDFFAPVGGFFNWGGVEPATGAAVNDSADQLMSVHARWLFPSAGFEAFAEWARNDFSGDLRDFLLEPDHSTGFTFGFMQTLGAGRGFTRIRGEITHLGRLLPIEIRASPTYYHHGIVRQGYTHRGQLLGAGIGPGSNSAYFGVDRYTTGGRIGGFLQWVRYGDDAFFANFAQLVREGHEVEVAAGLSVLRFVGPLDLGATLTLMRDLNRYYVIRNDVTNVNLRLRVAWRGS